MTDLSIKNWAEEDRPREKLLSKGRTALTDSELIAILLGSGSRTQTAVDLAKQVLGTLGNDLNRLAKLSVNDLKKFKGIGEAKAISIVSAMELSRRRRDADVQKTLRIEGSDDIYQLLTPHLLDIHHEEFWVVYLNQAHVVLGKSIISKGGVSGTLIDQKLVFKQAIEMLASAIVIVHNHPSGSLKPSQQDVELTKKVKQAALLFDIRLLDHVIFTNESYFSFSDEGVL